MPINWSNLSNLIALILQILAGLKPAPAAPFGDHKSAIQDHLVDAGMSMDTITKLLAYVEANWTTLVKLVTDLEAVFA